MLSLFNEGGFTSNLFNITCSQDGLTGTLLLSDPTLQLCQGIDATHVDLVSIVSRLLLARILIALVFF